MRRNGTPGCQIGENVIRLFICFSLTVLMLSGCATPYKQEGFSGGFSETQLDRNMFSVSFRGNGYSSPERVNEMALLRSADIALEHGYLYFVVLENNSRTSEGVYVTPMSSTTTRLPNGMATTSYAGGQVYNISKPSGTKLIMCLNERPATGISYDAKFVSESLSQKYKK